MVPSQEVQIIETVEQTVHDQVSWSRIALQIGVLAVIAAASVFASAGLNKQLDKWMPEPMNLASTYNGKPSGIEALLRLLESASKNRIKRWELPYRQLPKETDNVLVIVSPVQSLQPFEVKQILDWVRRGNVLLYLDDFSVRASGTLPAKLDIKVKSDVREIVDETIYVSESSKLETEDPAGSKWIAYSDPLFTHVKSLEVNASSRLAGGQPLVEDQQGSLLTRAKLDKGAVLLGVCPSFITNREISKKTSRGNFQLIANYLGKTHGTILFDERCHGYTGGTNVFVYIANSPFGMIILQLLLIIAIGVAGDFQRFGRAESLDERRKISNLEFIDGLAGAYRRARANPAVVEILFQTFLKRVARALGVSPHEPEERLIAAWNSSAYSAQADLKKLIDDYQKTMETRELSDADLKSMITTCDKITKLIDERQSAKKREVSR